MNTLAGLQKTLAYATNAHTGEFYRTLYEIDLDEPFLHIASMKDWLALPFVTKDMLIATPLSERSFIPLHLLDHLRTSSGTSGKPPLFSPRTPLRGMEYRMQYHSFSAATLAYCVPAMPHWHELYQKAHGKKPRVIAYDPKNHRASVRVARLAGVDSISTFAFHIRTIGEDMIQEKMNEQIRFIEICGESCTRALFEYIRTTFPNATLIPFYGSSEAEDSPMGMPCRAITGEEPLSLYHAKPSQYHELIDPLTGELIEPIAGAEGELVVTAFPGEPSAFPLVRFRTGDIARVIDTECCTHGTWSFTLLGRTELDSVKIPGGVLRADEIERVLRLFKDRVSDIFTLHCYTRETEHGPLFEPILEIEPRGAVALESLAYDISQKLLTGPTHTYATGVSEGRYLPLRCIVKDQAEKGDRKHTKIVRHN